METLDPNNDAENRHAVGGRKRSNRRSSILKTAKSPMKFALEDIDPNSIGTGKENREKKTRRSSSRRVSFAETNQIKEYCKDEEWHSLWERENASKFTDQQIEHSDSPSEYRQPTDTIKGLESLLKGNIQNTEQELEDQVEPSMDFTFCGGNINEQSSRQPLTSLNSYNQYQDEEQINASELTYHGQGLIEQDVNAIAGCNAFQYYDQALGSQKNLQYYKAQEKREQSVRTACNKENETMDFTVCHRGRFEASSHTMTGNNRTIVFDANSGDDLDSLELTCHDQGLIKQARVCQSTDTPKINPSSFLQSLGRRSSSQAKETPDHSRPLSLEQLPQKENMAAKVNPKSFLSSLGKSKVQVSKESIPNTFVFDKQKASIATSYSLEKTSQCIHGNTEVIDSPKPEEDMEMTTCLDVEAANTNSIENPLISEEVMDMTTCVPPASRLQYHFPATSDGQMDMTTCVAPALRLQDHSPAMLDGQMDMTTCVPPALRLQDHSPAMSDGQMDMTTCVPPALRLQDHSSAMLDGQMDMTTCVPPVPSSIFVEDECHIMNKRKEEAAEGMDMTAPIGNIQDSSEHDDGSATSGYNVYVTDGMDMIKCQTQSQEPSFKYQTDNRKRQNSSSIDSSLYSEEPSEKKKPVENQQDQEQRTNDPDTLYTGPISLDMHSSFNKKLGSSNWLNRTMPKLGQQKTEVKFLKSLPALSKSLMESDGPANKNIPHATFAPISNVPISRFCSQSAMKRKMIQIHNQELQEGIQGLPLPKPKSENEGPASSSVIGQEDDKPTDSCQPPDGKEILESCHSGAYQDAHEDEDNDDAVITFKDPICSMPELLSSENQMEEHSTVTGLMEEPTLEMDFTDQSTISVESNGIHGASLQEGQGKIHSPNNDSMSHTENQGRSQCAAKQQARNLSTICEENCEENESDCSKAAHHTAAADKGVALTKQKNMTVAELLSRANISFHNMEQVSRRSTIAFMKKAEKPKEDKEFLQLSLVTKPQALHYGDICTDIQKQLEQLKGKTEQMEVELNQSNASIFQHTDDSEIPKLEITLKDLKNICKKCARRKWIRRTAAMKRKLAFMLKENYEILSSDVHNIDETLLVTNDCIKLIDGIDNEMETGIKDLRKTIEDSEKGNKELDEVEALLHQKKTELESREAELKHVESQRSSLVNIKETLSSEKETLEREQLEHDEMLSNLKNKASAGETNETLCDQYKWLEGCLEWELTEWSQTHAKFLFLYNTLELRVDFHPSEVAPSCPSQPTIKKIQNISLSSQLADDSHLSARFVHSLVVNGLERGLLQNSNSNTAVLPKVLDHVTGLVIAARSLGNELFEMNFQYILTMKDNSVYVEFSSVKAFMKFIVQFTINVCKFPDEVKIIVIPKIGKCCVQDIQDALTAVPTGPKYMSRLVDTARQFLDKK